MEHGVLMGLRIDFAIEGDVQLSREFVRLSERGRDMRPAFRVFHDRLLEVEKKQFSSQGRFSGGWTPIKPSTVQRKRARGLDTKILHATHALRDSLTRKGDPNQRVVIRKTKFVFTSKLPYLGAHQNPRSTSNLPQRRAVELTSAERKRTMSMLQRFLVTGVAK